MMTQLRLDFNALQRRTRQNELITSQKSQRQAGGLSSTLAIGPYLSTIRTLGFCQKRADDARSLLSDRFAFLIYNQLAIYCILIALASLFGGGLTSLVKLTHRRIQLTLSFVSGVMLGVALLALLPHSIHLLKSPETTLIVCLFGLLFMFFMIRMFHFHQHDLAVDAEHSYKPKELCDHEQDHHHVHCDSHDGEMDYSWLGLCFGLAVHTIIDGIALAAAVQTTSPVGLSIGGLGVFLAILLHKPLDALSITSLMSAKGWSQSRQLVVNVIFCLMCPLGAILFALTVDQYVDMRDTVLGYALAFSAGIFLCISLGDLLPEVHFHSHDRVQLSIMLLLGVLVAFLIELGHNH